MPAMPAMPAMLIPHGPGPVVPPWNQGALQGPVPVVPPWNQAALQAWQQQQVWQNQPQAAKRPWNALRVQAKAAQAQATQAQAQAQAQAEAAQAQAGAAQAQAQAEAAQAQAQAEAAQAQAQAEADQAQAQHDAQAVGPPAMVPPSGPPPADTEGMALQRAFDEWQLDLRKCNSCKMWTYVASNCFACSGMLLHWANRFLISVSLHFCLSVFCYVAFLLV